MMFLAEEWVGGKGVCKVLKSNMLECDELSSCRSSIGKYLGPYSNPKHEASHSAHGGSGLEAGWGLPFRFWDPTTHRDKVTGFTV